MDWSDVILDNITSDLFKLYLVFYLILIIDIFFFLLIA